MYGIEVGYPLRVQRRLAGRQQTAQLSGTGSSLSERAVLLMENLEEPENAELSMTDVCRVMLEEAGQTTDEGSLVCECSSATMTLIFAVISVARRWVPVARMIETCGYSAIDGIRNFEIRGIPLSLGPFKPLEGLVGPFVAQCAQYTETPRASVARLAKVARDCQRDMRWT